MHVLRGHFKLALPKASIMKGKNTILQLYKAFLALIRHFLWILPSDHAFQSYLGS